MNRYSTSAFGGAPSKATATTLCQKCLKRDIYECKAVPQERPYVSRPSRTQQLFNPKLVPKLNSDVPQDLLRKKGIADEQLAKSEKERGQKRERIDDSFEASNESKRARSVSSISSASVATISTNASKSSSSQLQSTTKEALLPNAKSALGTATRTKRRRSLSSEGLVPSDFETSRARDDIGSSRSTRRKIGDLSPPTRGRRRSRSHSRDRNSSYSRSSPSRECDLLARRQNKTTEQGNESFEGRRDTRLRNRSPYRPRRQSIRANPDLRQQDPRLENISSLRRSPRRPTRSPNREDEGERVTYRGSLRRQRDQSTSSGNHERERYPDADGRSGMDSRSIDNSARAAPKDRGGYRAPPRNRSLSPFSKRLALTQAMNTGR